MTKTTVEEDIDVLKGATHRLSMLLAAPHPGLYTWWKATGEQLKIISDIYTGKDV